MNVRPLVVTPLRAEMPRGLEDLGLVGRVVGARARRLPPEGLGAGGPVVVLGSCGALVAGLPRGGLVLATEVVGGAPGSPVLRPDRALVESLSSAAEQARVPMHRARVAQADGVVEGPEREAFARATGAVVADLESVSLGLACAVAGRPWAVLRFVTDSPEHPLAWLGDLLGRLPEDEPPTGALVQGLLRRPWALPRLLGLAATMARGRRDARRVLATLAA